MSMSCLQVPPRKSVHTVCIRFKEETISTNVCNNVRCWQIKVTGGTEDPKLKPSQVTLDSHVTWISWEPMGLQRCVLWVSKVRPPSAGVYGRIFRLVRQIENRAKWVRFSSQWKSRCVGTTEGIIRVVIIIMSSPVTDLTIRSYQGSDYPVAHQFASTVSENQVRFKEKI